MGKGCSKWGDQMKIKAELPLGNDTKGVSNNGTHCSGVCMVQPPVQAGPPQPRAVSRQLLTVSEDAISQLLCNLFQCSLTPQ